MLQRCQSAPMHCPPDDLWMPSPGGALCADTGMPVLSASTWRPLRLAEEFPQYWGEHRGVDIMGLAFEHKH